MNKKLLIIGLICLVGLAGLVWHFGNGSSSMSDTAVAEQLGTLTDYSADRLQADATNILFFHADWCPSCRGLEKDLLANQTTLPDNINILKVDYDTQTDLKRQYNVIRQHTLVVVDGGGAEIRKLTGITNTTDQLLDQL